MGKVLSVFFDEAGQQDMSEGYYLLTLVLHDQSTSLIPYIEDYEESLSIGGLSDVPFHMVDLLHGHGDYEGMDTHERKSLLARFNAFVRVLPIQYHTFKYSSFDVATKDDLSTRMRRDIVDFIYANLESFLSCDTIAVYYDDGQQAVTRAVHDALGYMLGGVVVRYKQYGYQDRRLSQVADYLCSIELASIRYVRGEESSTYHKFFGMRGDFKRNYLKQAHRKLM